MTGPERPAYAVAVCEGRDCVRVADLGTLPGGPRSAAQAAVILARLAAYLRETGKIGRAVLLDQRTGRVVARRRVWPSRRA